VKTRGRDVLVGHPDIHEIIVFDPLCNDRTREERTRWSALRKLARRLQGYDLIVDCTGVPASCALVAMAKPQWSVGFSNSGFGFVFDQENWPVPDVPFVEKYLSLVQKAGVASTGLQPRIHLNDESNPASPFDVLLHLGTGFSLKQWGLRNFQSVAEQLRARGLRVATVGGRDDSADITGLTIREVAALANRCRTYVGLDTGLTHIVASLGVPTVAIYGPTNPRFSLQPLPNVRLVRLQLECSPLKDRRQCAACVPMVCSHHSCMRQITVEQVIREIELCMASSTPL
jgi:ADP-heptose:LPS heptosyltransferase